jgi:thiol:disulfide interchange protein
MPRFKYSSAAWFVGGLLCGLLVYALLLRFAGWSVVETVQLVRQQEQLAALDQENRELTADLFRFRPLDADSTTFELPYDDGADARIEVAAARWQAVEAGRYLMVTFGANWCLDCRNLHRQLSSPEVAEYAAGLFHFAQVDIGKFNRNLELAAELGADLSRGIPVAIVFDPSGAALGVTNEGQLEPARYYSSKQILRFLRTVVDRGRIIAPDSVD